MIELNHTSTYAPHNCADATSLHWHNTRSYQYMACGTCGQILRFRFKSWWKRLSMLWWDGVS